ncbi:carbon monoxide dehydrogenase subunit G [Kitasatospora sp. MAP5-34]|nr:carbon monoxide dehydrogenase subunit G [Kitasatospora sp. MAP5-34]
MPSIELSLSYDIAATPAAVLAHLADPENYIGLSPLLVGSGGVRCEGDGGGVAIQGDVQ